MPTTPQSQRTVAFIDGQNLYHGVREAFGYTYPNYDLGALAAAVCRQRGWNLLQTRFYTGVPSEQDNPYWNHFWQAKLPVIGRQGIVVYTRALRYRRKSVRLPDGSEHTFISGEEKGIDVRIALDVIRLAHRGEYDIALLFSQDQDLSEVAVEVQLISREQRRLLRMASAFPVSPASRNRRGIDRTDWIPIAKTTYDSCLDRRDYRPKRSLAA
jgi:uncharacterized LabA/DUF88 family protein